jgi:murein L,D-transpeptidase YafK
MDMPMPMKIWNTYRSRQIGAYYQSKGIKVIPTISWAERETFEFCFKGIPKESIVSVSTIGVKRDKEALEIWREGMDEMIEQINPSDILIYGGKLEYDYKGIKTHYFNNKVTSNWKGA